MKVNGAVKIPSNGGVGGEQIASNFAARFERSSTESGLRPGKLPLRLRSGNFGTLRIAALLVCWKQRLRAIFLPFMKRLNVAILGGGTVGGGVFRALRRNGSLLAARIGIRLRVNHIVVRHPRKQRPIRFPDRLVSADWEAAVRDPNTDVVVELIGGTSVAKSAVETALRLGKPVVTANKALLSEHGESLFAAAASNGAGLYYEASVGGGIPIIKVLRESLAGNRFRRIYGILNGTCNYILTQMEEAGGDFAAVLAEARKKGYAESDASLDVDGLDAMHKVGLLASLAHGFWVRPQWIHVEGIGQISRLDIEFAARLGYKIKLLASVCSLSSSAVGRSADCPQIQVSVGPALIPRSHVLASVRGVFNAVFVHSDVAGETLYYGRGAGQDATASAVLSDIASASLDYGRNSTPRVPPFSPHALEGQVIPWEESVSEYYLRLTVVDKPGTMAQISNVLACRNIGISSIVQPEGHEGASVPLILMIHDASAGEMLQALEEIRHLSVVKSPPKMIRAEHFQ